MNTVEPRYCEECGNVIKRTDRKMKRCMKCIGKQISRTKAENLANGVTFTYPPYVPERGKIYMLVFEDVLCKIGRTINLKRRLYDYRRRFGDVNYYHTFPAYDTHKAEDYFRGIYRREKDEHHGLEWYWLDQSDVVWFKTIIDQYDLTPEVYEARERRRLYGDLQYLTHKWFDKRGVKFA